MELTTWIKSILEIGITSGILLTFVYYFLQRSKKSEDSKDKQLQDQSEYFLKRDESWDKRLEDQRTIYRERENILVAESSRREEILRKEAERREEILRQESTKRETQLMVTIEDYGKTMKEISATMESIKNSNLIIETRLGSIENRFERIESQTGKDDLGNGECGHSESKGA